jgi:hypothetical protein
LGFDGPYLPDISLLDADLRTVRVIEVVTTNPTPEKKMRFLIERGVEVLQVPVRSEEELYALRPAYDFELDEVSWRPFWAREDGPGLGVNHRSLLDEQRKADEWVDDFTRNLVLCSPAQRRKLLTILRAMNSTASLLALRPDNPKKAVLYPTGTEPPST